MKLHRIKFKSIIDTPNLIMKAIAILGAIAAGVLFFFAVIFALASSYQGLTAQTAQTRLITSAFLFIIGVAIIVGIYFVTRKAQNCYSTFRSFRSNERSRNKMSKLFRID